MRGWGPNSGRSLSGWLCRPRRGVAVAMASVVAAIPVLGFVPTLPDLALQARSVPAATTTTAGGGFGVAAGSEFGCGSADVVAGRGVGGGGRNRHGGGTGCRCASGGLSGLGSMDGLPVAVRCPAAAARNVVAVNGPLKVSVSATEHAVAQRAGAAVVNSQVLAEIIACAFGPLDVAGWHVPDDDERRRIFLEYRQIVVEHGLRQSTVHTTCEWEIVTIWRSDAPSGVRFPSLPRMAGTDLRLLGRPVPVPSESRCARARLSQVLLTTVMSIE